MLAWERLREGFDTRCANYESHCVAGLVAWPLSTRVLLASNLRERMVLVDSVGKGIRQ